jgi:hypothetical protein
VAYERITVNDVELIHTHRGYNDEIEVYYFQNGPRTYNLFKKKGDQGWRCDWVTSHSQTEVDLEADATDLDAMLRAFTAMLKSEQLVRNKSLGAS